MSQDLPEPTVRIEARWDNVVASRTLPAQKAGTFAAQLRRRGWTVRLIPSFVKKVKQPSRPH